MNARTLDAAPNTTNDCCYAICGRSAGAALRVLALAALFTAPLEAMPRLSPSSIGGEVAGLRVTAAKWDAAGLHVAIETWTGCLHRVGVPVACGKRPWQHTTVCVRRWERVGEPYPGIRPVAIQCATTPLTTIDEWEPGSVLLPDACRGDTAHRWGWAPPCHIFVITHNRYHLVPCPTGGPTCG